MYKNIILVTVLIFMTLIIFKCTCKSKKEDFIDVDMKELHKLTGMKHLKFIKNKLGEFKKKIMKTKEELTNIEKFIDFNFIYNNDIDEKENIQEEVIEETVEEETIQEEDDDSDDEEVEGFMDGCGVHCASI